MSKNKIYPFAVASVRSMENKLLSKQKLMQMAEAKSVEEAVRMLSDTAYGKTQIQDVHQFEQMIESHLEETYTSVAKLIPDEALIDIFLYKNDYHNVKVLIKEEISRVSGKRLLVRGGTIPLEVLVKSFRERNYAELPTIDGDAVEEAIALYAKTKNGQYIDTVLDKACFAAMAARAAEMKNRFVQKYVMILADLTNLKTALRVKMMRRPFQAFEDAYVVGGSIRLDIFVRAFRDESLIPVLKETAYGSLCEQNMEQGFTVFEKACDDYLMDYVKEAKYKTLTPEPVVAYILAKETEAKCVRIILTCKMHEIDAEIIKERVREVYV
ncbi:V-type ATP synthase subunit C [Anaerotignum lactatifermentans]|uniref:V-type ATP synthase subunit C n=1 Tax=Anaerotignum lactatifermentans TaxID=160404 RepID=A0ABS2GA19_9FIRM|nr:V-type ATP synthase subunit C [Anaerotignum lactatifermentans]MBM6828343.1 V-type ATP synthase subunit C [Anaerotignum lactatifermentans]MBM6877623.1 V-type ATP synthase subunit C [Anaerotignum lactatifermentans]MBM6949926.1 V-type ATP synthase subunit C [Anaerotignum lactatifermentans]